MNMEQFKRHCEAAQKAFTDGSYIWFGTFLYGSQNYGLDTEESDVDTVSLYIPTLKTMAGERGGKLLSIEKIFDSNDESVKDHMVLKDIRLWIKELSKGSPNAIELVYTFYKEINKDFYTAWRHLVGHNLFRINPQGTIKALVGMVWTNLKKVAYPRDYNERDSAAGYNVKAFSESIRFIYALFSYCNPTSNYAWAFTPRQDVVRKFILEAKKGEIERERAMGWVRVFRDVLIDQSYLQAPIMSLENGFQILNRWIEDLFEDTLNKS